MRRWLGPGAVALGALAAAGWWNAEREARENLPIPEVTAQPAIAPADAPEDPEALSAWFQQQVLAALDSPDPTRPVGVLRTASDSDSGIWPAGLRDPLAQFPGGRERYDLERLVAASEVEPVGDGFDWEYLQDVYEGRVSGIPSEQRAGIRLIDMVRFGDVPYVEALREANDLEGLQELGLDQQQQQQTLLEPEGRIWPYCIRTGTCRRDAASSPPGS